MAKRKSNRNEAPGEESTRVDPQNDLARFNYIRKRYPPLTRAEFDRVFDEYRLGSREAASRLVGANIGLVIRIALRYVGRGIELPDLVQEGLGGVQEALSRYDTVLGYRFSTYAVWWIRNAMQRLFENTTLRFQYRVPVSTHAKLLVVRKIYAEFKACHQRSPERHELVELLERAGQKIAPGMVNVLLSIVTSERVSLDTREGAWLADTHPDHLQGQFAVEQEMQAARMIRKVRAVFTHLTRSQQALLNARYGLDGGPLRTLQEIGDERGLCRERIRQLESMALDDLAFYACGDSSTMRAVLSVLGEDKKYAHKDGNLLDEPVEWTKDVLQQLHVMLCEHATRRHPDEDWLILCPVQTLLARTRFRVPAAEKAMQLLIAQGLFAPVSHRDAVSIQRWPGERKSHTRLKRVATKKARAAS